MQSGTNYSGVSIADFNFRLATTIAPNENGVSDFIPNPNGTTVKVDEGVIAARAAYDQAQAAHIASTSIGEVGLDDSGESRELGETDAESDQLLSTEDPTVRLEDMDASYVGTLQAYANINFSVPQNEAWNPHQTAA